MRDIVSIYREIVLRQHFLARLLHYFTHLAALNNKYRYKTMTYNKTDSKEKIRTLRPFPLEGIGRFSERLSLLMENESLRSFSRKVEISDGTIRKYLENSEPSLTRLVLIAHNCGVNVDWLATGRGEMSADAVKEVTSDSLADCPCVTVTGDDFTEEFALIPGYHISVSTGHGELARNESIKRRLAFRIKWLKFRNLNISSLAIVFAKGDSMEPTIHNGNSLLIDLADTKPTEGSIFVLRFGDELYAKRLQKHFNGGVKLISDNKEYDDQLVRPEEIEQLQIVGKVIWVGKDLY